ncbi:dihydroorotate dehydrogenase (quinone), mitochondrial isoform X2 [Diachasma alloeum]|nr:dihydroorotate dehydrogenase (quinone), mitochondrial isoform X2 [Diachasma alloeum]XP_015109005.1 dihydroorotate dehydrogenase (quinone), mitochondrial isoform X2 [Diachasma alloeum]XP_015109006.1 dihydroorotate dehydrogenase (quinone), mitochondrial isoform X2 [Diachasma alloeum]
MPLVRLVDPEVAHNLAVTAAKYGLTPSQKNPDPAALKTSLWGLNFNNPVGMAAGFDKQGEAVQGLTKMGFGFVEIGSVTPNPQPGNPKPRVFRLPEDKAVINRYGFNSDGHEAVYERLKTLRNDPTFTGIIGVNLGKNKTSEDSISDYSQGIRKFSDVADYLVINISSPNTQGLRNLQSKKNLEELLIKINEVRESMERKPPLLLKLAPDLTDSECQDIADVIQKNKSKVDGLILSNTTVSRGNLVGESRSETGGLSGAPLTDKSTLMIADMYKRTKGKIPIVGVGGIFDGNDAYDKIKAGASLVQIYTSYAYHGPPIVQRIKRELDGLITRDGHSSVADAVGGGDKR